MSTASVHGIHRSPGGVPKLPVDVAAVGAAGLEGDVQRDLRHHGGPDRAVCLYSLERLEALRAEGHSVHPGAIGENLTLAGLDWEAVVPGVRLSIGDALRLEVTGYATPCRSIAPCFFEEAFHRVSQKVHPGWSRVYTRVLAGGSVRIGDPVAIDRPE